MIQVRFYGDLRDFGDRFRLHVKDAKEALHALMMQIDGLRAHLEKGEYRVRFNKVDQTEETLADGLSGGSGVLHIVPVVRGAGKNGVWQTIAGVVLVVVGAFTGGSDGGFLINAGIGLILGGVAQMLTKTPKLEPPDAQNSNTSSSFSNLQNTSAQGRPIPLAFGRVYCGSRLISQGLETYRVDVDAAKQTVDPTATILTELKKTFTQGVPALAPNGQPYNTDFNNSSVRDRNYTVVVEDKE